MGAAPSQEPSGDSGGLPLPRWALWIMLPGIVGPLLIFGFIVFSESAHDEDACPYREVSRQPLAADVTVIEEGRSCVDEIEERRFSLARGSAPPRVLGRRRFELPDFSAGRYHWTAEISEVGEVVVRVHNDGHDDLLLREGTPEERAKGISY